MTKTTIFAAAIALALGTAPLLAQEEEHQANPIPSPEDTHSGGHVTDYAFSFEGPFGRFDQAQLQRGLQVYTEVCSACHGLRYLPYRELSEHGGPAMTEEQMRAYAAMHDVTDADTGETRPATPSDHFGLSADPNAPDLTLMAKARAGFHGPVGLGINQLLHGIGGPEYIASLLHGFTGEEKTEAGATLYENPIFASGWISMPPPLSDGQVTYADGTEATVEQMSQDVAAFLMWTAEPKMMARKSAGLTAVLFLIVLTVLLYFTNKKIWAPHKGIGPDKSGSRA
jgi:ubiquinol-cytochrome c reductase cytochrome c1 subunit